MKHKFSNCYIIKSYFYGMVCSFVLICFLIPGQASAAIIHASAGTIVYSSDTNIIDVFLDTEDEVVNSVEGTLSLEDEHQGNFEIKDLSIVNSAFTMWPRKPSLQDGHKITFVGGLPNGVKGDHVLLFKIIIKINEAGNFSIKPENIVAYLNDGLGTSRNITKEDSIISVGVAGQQQKNKWQEIISNDNVAPEPFEIKVIKDENLFDGKKFLSFETTDQQSGISYYEVREGGYPAVRTGTTYLLINQDKDIDVTVTAYDKAGNFQVATFKEKEKINWKAILISVIIIIIVRKIIKVLIRKRKSVK